MRDPAYITTWSASLAQRVRSEETRQSTRSTAVIEQPSTAGFTIMRSSENSVARLRTLPSTSLILLLTPILNPGQSDTPRSRGDPLDPFEPLGRKLAEHHPRIRHVPWIPKTGLTEIHRAFIEEAAAVILVVCESATAGGGSLTKQTDCATAVAERAEKKPLILMHFGDHNGHVVNVTNFEGYRVVLSAGSVSQRNIAKAAKVLFEEAM